MCPKVAAARFLVKRAKAPHKLIRKFLARRTRAVTLWETLGHVTPLRLPLGQGEISLVRRHLFYRVPISHIRNI